MRNIINDKYRKNIFEHRSKQSREREITPNKKIIQVSASGGVNTFLEAEHKPGNYTGVCTEAAESAAPAQVRRRRSEGSLRYLNYAGRIRHKTTWRML